MSFATPLTLGGEVDFIVEIATSVDEVGGGLWDDALWNDGIWASTGANWFDASLLAMLVSTTRGRDTFDQRFRTGVASILWDNQIGVFNPDGPFQLPLRPGRWWRVRARASGTAQSGEFIFPALPGSNDNRIDTDRLTDDDASGVTITGTFTPGPGLGTANQTIAGNWSGNTLTRSWLLQLNSNSQLRFVFQDPINGQINTVHPSNLSDGVAYPFTVRWVPGSPVTIEVDGVLFTSAETGDDMQQSTVPVMIGRQTSGGGFYDGMIETLRVTPATGIPFRLDGFDVGENGLLTNPWTDIYGNVLTPEGDISLEGFTEESDYQTIFTGQIESMIDVYRDAARAVDSSWDILDFMARLQIDDPPNLETPVGDGDLTSERVVRILDDINWPESQRGEIQTGFNTMQESVLGQSRLEELQLAADAEGGGLFMDPDGRVTFVNRDFLEGDRSVNVQWEAGAIGNDLEILQANTNWSQSRVQNDIRYKRVGGNEQREAETQSWALYGQRTKLKTDFQNDEDSQVQTLAERTLQFFQWDRKRVESITVHPLTEVAAQQLIDTRLGDRIRATIRTADWSYTAEYWIARISHQISQEDWTVTFRIDDTNLTSPVDTRSFDEEAFDEGFN